MAGIPSADECADRLRTALAEAGHPDANVTSYTETREDGWPVCGVFSATVSANAWWRAVRLVYPPPHACWSCFISQTGDRCRAGDCQHPEGPAVPPPLGAEHQAVTR